MKKLFSGVFLTLILILTSSPTFAATTQIKIDGVTIVSDVNPESKSNRTMVPLRVISEILGANVKWSDSQVTLTKNDMKVILKLNSNKVVKNGKTELLDVKPYMKNNRTFVPMRFIAETFGSNVNYKNGTVTVDTKPLVIDGVKVKALQHEYHATMGGVVQQIKGNGYNEAIYNIFIENKGSKVEPPSDYTWSVHSITTGGYYKGGQYDFLDQEGNSVERFDIYNLVRGYDEKLPLPPQTLIHVPTENQWYLFSDPARQAIDQLIDRASVNGFVTVIINTVP
ncbi:copper amine oxidase [Lysinibacillus sp. 2017]|uniref:copper amine oxidase N-terminal domain-containing protein n=1 Tax=unclassified Lysinibacillus TaxID=2636778 RepID=UPI000D52863B|nr:MULTISPECIES: copper amine oxidase N-terminal domain-containing protein [unclassified Lysinibacillus]AWE07712.1 copper amine oxidase [Lysinibacillus sp. 2017]TGN30771.1 copper amine oxidase N-terminal domain-containing protein [Lysinibacillus sp. S2017]